LDASPIPVSMRINITESASSRLLGRSPLRYSATAREKRNVRRVEPSLTKIFGWIVVTTLTPVFRPFATQTPITARSHMSAPRAQPTVAPPSSTALQFPKPRETARARPLWSASCYPVRAAKFWKSIAFGSSSEWSPAIQELCLPSCKPH
jgi:hypothetical protein